MEVSRSSMNVASVTVTAMNHGLMAGLSVDIAGS
jgi:lipid-binding SYLF domain-containing protein